MAFGLLGVRLFLAVVFLAAGIGKLLDQAGFRKTLASFGVPERLVVPLAGLLPPLELVVAGLLIPAPSGWWGALTGLVLLLAFTAAIALNLARGRTPDCRCFGATASTPIGPATLARNAVLAVGAALVIATGPGAGLSAARARWDIAPADTRMLVLAVLALAVALAATSWRAGQIRATNALLRSQIEGLEQRLRAIPSTPAPAGVSGLPLGAPAPSFELPLLEGDNASLDTLKRAGLPIVLIFSSAHCPACSALWPDVGKWQREHGDTLTIAAICGGPPLMIEAKLMGTGVRTVLLRPDTSVPDSYHLSEVPSAVVVTADGRIDSQPATGVADIRKLVAARIAG